MEMGILVEVGLNIKHDDQDNVLRLQVASPRVF